MLGRRRAWISVLVLLVCLAYGAEWVVAALSVQLEPSRAAPGDTVRIVTVGEGALRAVRGETLDVLLAAPGDPNDAVVVGQLNVDDAGNGSGKFVVPAFGPGKYDVLLDCPPCAAFSSGRAVLPVGELEIISGAAPETATERAVPAPAPLEWLVLVAGVLTAAIMAVVRWRSVSSPPAGRKPLE